MEESNKSHQEEKAKGGRGRRPLPKDEIRDNDTYVRLSEKELKSITADMEKQGYKHIGTYLRDMALSRKGHTTRHHPDLQEIIHQVRKIGANLNQVARALNASTGLQQTEKTFAKYSKILEEIKATLVYINRKITDGNEKKE